jgi:hypothetical protein
MSDENREIAAPGVSPSPSESETSLKEARAQFGKLLAKQNADDALMAPVSTELPGRPPKAKKEKVEVKAEEPEPEAVEPEEEEDADAVSPEMEKLRAKLLLAGNPKGAIETLSEKDLGDWWKKQEEREQVAATSRQRASDLEKELKALKETTTEAEPLAGVPTADEDLVDMAASLSAQFGEDESKALVETFRSLVAPIQQENAQIKEVLEAMRQQGIEKMTTDNRSRLSEQLPMLKENDTAWSMIQGAVESAVNSSPGKYASADTAYDDIFKAIYGDLLTETPAPVSEAKSKAKARIAASTPEAPRSVKKQQIRSPEDQAKAAFSVLYKNPEDIEGAARAFGAHRVQ